MRQKRQRGSINPQAKEILILPVRRFLGGRSTPLLVIIKMLIRGSAETGANLDSQAVPRRSRGPRDTPAQLPAGIKDNLIV